MSKTWKKIRKVLVKGDIGGQILKVLTPAEQNAKLQKEQMDAATRASEAAMQQQAEFDAQAQRLASNQAGLTGANAANDTTKFDIGGMDSPDTILDDMRKRRGKSATSSQLGIV